MNTSLETITAVGAIIAFILGCTVPLLYTGTVRLVKFARGAVNARPSLSDSLLGQFVSLGATSVALIYLSKAGVFPPAIALSYIAGIGLTRLLRKELQ